MRIELNNIKPSYMSEGELAGSGIYLQKRVVFEQGKKYIIKASSGRGKTSILDFIYGTNPNYRGNVSIQNSNAKSLRKTQLSYVFQDLKLFPALTVFENIQLKNTLTNHKTKEEIYGMIGHAGLQGKENQIVKTISLGQMQRVAILRALCQPFGFLLLDEPFSHIDQKNIESITRLIDIECNNNNAGLIITSLENEYLFDYDTVFHL